MLLADTLGESFFAQLGHWLAELFGGDTPRHPLTWYQVASRAAIVYVIGLALFRIGKSRILSRVTALDVIVGFILGSLLSRGITGDASISETTVASTAIIVVHWIFSYLAFRSHELGKIIKGNSIPIVENGRLNEDNMRRSHISQHDLEQHLRLAGVSDLSEVQAAYKERNGEVSVIRRPKS